MTAVLLSLAGLLALLWAGWLANERMAAAEFRRRLHDADGR